MLSSSPVEQHNVASTSEISAVMSEAESAAQNIHATTKVLGTDELLLLILESVPVHDRLPLLRVSKKWNSIASSIGYVVEPAATGIDLCNDSSDMCIFRFPPPRYAIDGTIRINPAINSSATAISFHQRKKSRLESIQYGNRVLRHMGATVILESILDPSRLRSIQHEFITSPPTTMVLLGIGIQIFGTCGDHTFAAILRENTGIRIGHLLDSFARMRACALHTYVQDPRGPGPAAYPIDHEPKAFFHYFGRGVVTYLEGSETNSEKQYANLMYDS